MSSRREMLTARYDSSLKQAVLLRANGAAIGTKVLQRELALAVPKRSATAKAKHGIVVGRWRFDPDNLVLRLAGRTLKAADRLRHGAHITRQNEIRTLLTLNSRSPRHGRKSRDHDHEPRLVLCGSLQAASVSAASQWPREPTVERASSLGMRLPEGRFPCDFSVVVAPG
jgi:hypothetical protein